MRKREKRGTEPFPAKTFAVRLLDRLVLVVGIIGPLITVPQILKIYVAQNAGGISVIAWGMWALLDIPWIIYGIVHRETPISITYSLYFVLNIVVVIEALAFGAGLS